MSTVLDALSLLSLLAYQENIPGPNGCDLDRKARRYRMPE